MAKNKYYLICFVFLSVTTNILKANTRTQPYCGLYCLYSVMKIEKMEIDFKQLVKPEYIGLEKGSSLTELKKCAEDNNLYATAVGRFSSGELKNCKAPVILHVKSETASDEYDHYVLYLGTESGKAKIFDPPNPVELMPFHKLVPMWDGTGLIVSAEPVNLAKIFAPARKKFIIFSVIVIVGIFAIRTARKHTLQKMGNISKKANFGFSIAQFSSLVIFALFGGMVFHFTTDAGFLAHAGATESIAKANMEHFIPKINIDKVNDLIRNRAVIIDARRSNDFKAGHIENAVNIPTTLCKAGRESKLAGIDKNSQVIVYCQSKGCGYATNVASNLANDGFKNIFIYKNGWMDWSSNENK